MGDYAQSSSEDKRTESRESKKSYKVKIIHEEYDWICKRMASSLSFASDTPQSEICYFLPYTLLSTIEYEKQKGKILVCLFTHLEEREEAKRERYFFAERVCHAGVYLNETDYKASRLKLKACIHPATDIYKERKVFGVCGKIHKSGRKNEHFIEQLHNEGFKIFSWGEDWKPYSTHNFTDRKTFYESIDYLIIPSSIEGAPVPLFEAMNMGVPVIAPNVGACHEFPVIKYEKNDFGSLWKTVTLLERSRLWDRWESDHRIFFDYVWNSAN